MEKEYTEETPGTSPIIFCHKCIVLCLSRVIHPIQSENYLETLTGILKG
jgi:hypothetical protein